MASLCCQYSTTWALTRCQAKLGRSALSGGLATFHKRSQSSCCSRSPVSHIFRTSNFLKGSPTKTQSLAGLMFKQYMSDMSNQGIIFRQLFEGRTWTYTYILGDPESKEAILIDPVLETVDRDLKIISDLGLDLKFAINTHVHADHITGTGEIKKKLPTCKSMIAKVAGAKADEFFDHGEKIKFGKYEIECRSTPGHTNGCTTFVWHGKNMAFTGDALLIRGCGRTDFQQGSSDTLYESVHSQIFSLPENYMLYPAHDYTGQTMTTVEEEKRCNPRLTKSKADFIKIMENLNLPYPKYIDKALPANLVCGMYDVEADAAN